MKKSVGLVLIGMLLFASYAGGVFAEEEVDMQTQEEISVMVENNYGVEMRFLQLERAIGRRVLWANEIIDVLKEDGEDTTELEGIVAELDALADEAAETDKSEREAAIENFIRIKREAKEKVAEFREIAGPMLSEEQKDELRQRFDEIDRTELQNLKDRIAEKRRLFNANKARGLLESMGIEDEELIRKAENGEVAAREIGEKLREHYAGVVAEKREQFKENVKSKIADRVNARQAEIARFVAKKATAAAQRAEGRMGENGA